jgi:two-component system sensor histidine kinase KdpD
MTRIIACVSSHPKTEMLLQSARRAARDAGVEQWAALYIETPQDFRKDSEYQQRVLRFLTQAEEWGATIVRQPASTVADGIRDYLKTGSSDERIILLVGNPETVRSRFWERRPLTQRLIHTLPTHCQLMTIPLKGRSLYVDSWTDILGLRGVRFSQILYAAVAVLIACVLVEILRATMSYAEFSMNNYNISIVFMLPTVFIAGRFGLFPGLITAALSYFTMNYLYIQPLYQLDIEDYPIYLNAVLFMLSVVAIAFFGSYTYGHSEVLRKRERRMQALFTVNDVISSAFTRREALSKLHRELQDLLEMEVAIFLPPVLAPEGIALAWPEMGVALDTLERKALEQSWEESCTAGNATPRHINCLWRFQPMIAGQDRIGVLGVKIPKKMHLDASFGQLLAALADQTGNVLARIELSQTMEAQRVSEEREKLRSMLLSSVSHDLKTPLASIIGSLSVYHGMFDVLSIKRKHELTQTALEEAQRLDSFITNILDMTRLESGGIRFRRDWENPEDMVNRVIRRLKARLRRHRLEIMPPPAPLEVCIDVILTEQVVQNLLDNAAKYAPPSTLVRIEMGENENGFYLTIQDEGPGVPEGDHHRVFDKYARLKQKDSKTAGTGLGLAIVKAIVEGQGGSINVSNGSLGGACFTVQFPSDRVRPYEHGESEVSVMK